MSCTRPGRGQSFIRLQRSTSTRSTTACRVRRSLGRYFRDNLAAPIRSAVRFPLGGELNIPLLVLQLPAAPLSGVPAVPLVLRPYRIRRAMLRRITLLHKPELLRILVSLVIANTVRNRCPSQFFTDKTVGRRA